MAASGMYMDRGLGTYSFILSLCWSIHNDPSATFPDVKNLVVLQYKQLYRKCFNDNVTAENKKLV